MPDAQKPYIHEHIKSRTLKILYFFSRSPVALRLPTLATTAFGIWSITAETATTIILKFDTRPTDESAMTFVMMILSVPFKRVEPTL